MEKTNHVMIVGDGARRFAVAEGFEEMNLLTEHSRKIWLAWKAKSSFNWRPGIDSPEWREHISAIFDGDENRSRTRNASSRIRRRARFRAWPSIRTETFRHDDDFRIVVENSGARGGLADHWGGLQRGQ